MFLVLFSVGAILHNSILVNPELLAQELLRAPARGINRAQRFQTRFLRVPAISGFSGIPLALHSRYARMQEKRRGNDEENKRTPKQGKQTMARPGQNAAYVRGFRWILTIVNSTGNRQEFLANGKCPIEAMAVFQSAQKFSGYADWTIVGLRRADQKEIF